MGNSKAKISERTTKPNQKPRKKRWPTTSTPSLRSALGAPLPIPSSATDGTTTGWSPAGTSTTSSRSSGACKLGGGQGGKEQRQDGGQDQRLRVQARGVEGLRAIRKTSRGRHEEKKVDGSGYIQRSFSRSYSVPTEAEADKMVSNLFSEGVLVITTPKSSPALTDATHEAK